MVFAWALIIIKLASTMSNSTVGGIFNIKPQSDYLGGFIATGVMSIVQTITPLLVYQLWQKKMVMEDMMMNKWF